jgi:signal transduction histidine kinase
VTAESATPETLATSLTLATLRKARAQQEAAQRWISRLAPLFLVGVIAISIGAYISQGPAGHNLYVLLAATLFMLSGMGILTSRRRQIAVNAGLIAVMVASSAVLVWLEPGGTGVAGIFVCLVLLAPRVLDRIPGTLAVAGIVSLAVIAEIGSRHSPASAVLGGIAIAGFCGMTFLARRLAQATHQAERLLLELDRTREAQARSAGLAERQRLAREMHDVLAHSLSGLMLQLEAARMLAANAPDDPRLPGIIDLAHHLGKTGLEEARGAIGMLRDDELPGPAGLAGLAAQFQEVRGVPCRFTVSGQPRELGSEVRLAVYRVAQEALTNVAKHASPERVEVRLAYEPGDTRLTVEDFAIGRHPSAAPASDGHGYGLTGMRERAELLGGQLAAVTTGRGFLVELRVPG